VLMRRILPAALGLWAGVIGSGRAQEAPAAQEPNRLGIAAPAQAAPAPTLTQNQRLANAIADALRQTGKVVEVTGHVADQSQRDEVIRIVHSVPGVDAVRDRLRLPNADGIIPAQAALPGTAQVQDPGPQTDRQFQPQLNGAPPQDPISIMPVMPGPNPQMNPPPMPPYAWPTYAPYNNFSRVAYPTLYPYEAWPNIGPMYPFPKVPPGWRGISLRWQDGHWWYGKEATGHDWWRIRYW
jgi:BON domain